MIDDAITLLEREYRTARRLARLFRIERAGGFARWPTQTVRQLIERRASVVGELMRLDARRLSVAPSTTADLDIAIGALAREVDCAEQQCLKRLADLGAELEKRRGIGTATGLRGGGGGRLLGSG
jgi:hypothetical protein